MIEFIEKLSTSGTLFRFYLFGLQFYSQDILFLFFKKKKCFALKQIQYATVTQYTPRVPFRSMILPFFQNPKCVNHPTNSHSSCKTKLRCLLLREAFLRCSEKNISFQLPRNLVNTLPLLLPPSLCVTVVCDNVCLHRQSGPQYLALHHTKDL